MPIGRGAIRGLALLGALLAGTSLASGQTLKVVPQADLKNLDPIWTTAAITQNHGYMIYDTLFALDEKLEPRPQMIESYTVSDDALTWTFTLREGLLFHDGTPVEAKDAVASLKRWNVKRAGGQALAALPVQVHMRDGTGHGPMIRAGAPRVGRGVTVGVRRWPAAEPGARVCRRRPRSRARVRR